MNIGFAGCSYTYGHELEIPERNRFSKLICDQFNANEYNVGKAGISNDEICMKTVELIDTVSIDFMFVQITTSNRFSFVLDDRIVSMRPSAIPGRPLISKEGNDFDLINKIVYSSDSQRKTWYPLTRWKIRTLSEYLNSKNVKHVFTFMSDHESEMFMKDVMIREKDRYLFDSLQSITKEMPKGKWMHPLEEGHRAIADYISEVLR